MKLIPHKPLLRQQFLPYQLYRDPESGARIFGEGLRTSQASIGRMYWASDGKNLSEPVEHNKCSTLIGQPSECGQRNEPIRSDYDKPFQTMSDAREASIASLLADSVFNR